MGRLVIEGLAERVPGEQIVAAVRSFQKASSFGAHRVQLREADYTCAETLTTALRGVQRILLISTTDTRERFGKHKAVIDAARQAEVELLVYTSLLHADTSELFLAREHKQTEEYIRASGLRFVILRNGWYMENHTSALASGVEHGALIGSSGEGRFASAARADYAAAAVAVLTEPASGKNIYELAGDQSFSMAELADEVSTQIGWGIPYRNLSSEAYAAMLLGLGLSQMVIDVIIDADRKAIRGDLDSTARDLRELINRPTTPLSDAVRRALLQQSQV